MSNFKEVRSNYYNEEEKATYIDAWKTANDNEEGKVVVKVFDNGTVEYLVESAKTDALIQDEIQTILNKLTSRKMINIEKEFIYNGFTFIPHRKLNENEKGLDLSNTMKVLNMRRDNELGMWNYDDRKVDYNYKEFYKIADSVEIADIFYCVEMKKYYIPCGNEMFQCNK
jgi:hypothetical protein